MKRFTFLAVFFAMVLGMNAQYYMHVWYNDSVFSLPVLNVDSITFTDKWLEPGEPVEPEPETPSEGIGVFSVSADKKVTFSPGNLQYHPKNNEWRFAENQTDYIGSDNANIADDYDGWLDLFGWSTGANNFGVSRSTNEDDYAGDFVDWGTNPIGDDAPNTWRTLTYDEWDYLLYNRTNANELCGVAQVNGVNGLIFLPDTWVCPEGVTFKSGFHSSNGVDYYAAYQTFTADQWSKMEASGAIFLPAAGYHYGSGVNVVQRRGYYWSTTEGDSGCAYCLSFSSDVASMFDIYRLSGRSVRLVKDVEDEPVDSEQPGEGVEPEPDPVEPYKSIGIFTVGEGKAISFASGNLQYTQSTNTWTFASAQWEMLGTDNVTGGGVSTDPTWGDSKSGTALADKVDLFGWSTSATNFGVSTSEDYNDYSGSFIDWGTNKIGNDAPNTWRTLTYDEWYYLRYTRTNANDLCGVAQVNGVNGLIFLPDNWTCPVGVTFKSGVHSSNGVDYYAAYQTFTADQWSKLEAAGAIFLPAAGYREGTYVYNVQYDGGNWSATERNSNGAYGLYFYSEVVGWGYSDRTYGRSVRLVKDTIANSTNQPTDPYNGHEYVDLGLPSGLKWATCNVGANAPEEYGDYFAWGEVESKTTYNWSTYKWCNGSNNTLTKYNYKDGYGTLDNKMVLDKEDDAAAVNWGGAWRMPTKAEQDELLSNCTWTWTTQNGVNGYKVTGPSGNCIFLPAVGYRKESSLFRDGSNGNFWLSSLYEGLPDNAYGLFFDSEEHVWSIFYRFYGRPVRPVCDTPDDVLPSEPEAPTQGIGVFSVSADKQVTFSKGNLQYTQSTNTWSFASAQWEVFGTDNVTGGSVSSDQYYGDSKYGDALADKIDLFGWSTSATNFGVSTSTDRENDYSGSFIDWGTNQIGSDAPNTWRTLTYDEWYYLLNNRNNAFSLCGVAQVNGVNGLIFLPDTWTCPAGVTFKSGFHSEWGVDYYAAYQTFTAEQWSKLEAAGAVFLPAAGYRYGSFVYYVQYTGHYWSATERGGYFASCLDFYSVEARTGRNGDRYYGQSVRLVKDLQ